MRRRAGHGLTDEPSLAAGRNDVDHEKLDARRRRDLRKRPECGTDFA